MVWKGDIGSAETFITELNNNINLRFTVQISQTQVAFLDTNIYVSANKLESTLYRKPTAGNATLHALSSHPSHLIRSIPYGEILRLKLICSTNEEFIKCSQDALIRFKARGYNVTILQQASDQAALRTRESLLKVKTRTPETEHTSEVEDVAPWLITTFNRQHRQLRANINKNWSILKTDAVLAPSLPIKPTITFRGAVCMRNQLVKNSLESTSSGTWLQPKKGFLSGPHVGHVSLESTVRIILLHLALKRFR